MKKLLRIAACLLSVACLAACTLPGSDNGFSAFDPDNVQTDPVKDGTTTTVSTDNTGNVDTAKPDTNTTGGDTEPDGNTQIDDSVIPTWYSYDAEYTDNASFYGHITAFDDDGNILWAYGTDEIMVGQYDDFTDIGERDNGYYFVADGVLYCLNKADGSVLWQVEGENGVGSSCSYDFDENGTIYLCGYEGPSLVVVDKNGKLGYYGPFSNRDEEDFEQYFWHSGLWYENGKVIEAFDSTNTCLVVDPKTGEAHPEEFDENADWSTLCREWEFLNWQSDDGSTSAEGGGRFEVEFFGEDYLGTVYMNIKYISESGNEVLFEYMPVRFRSRDLYDGVSDYFYGVWTGECQPYYDEDNSFAFQMTDPDTLEVIWFTSKPDGYTIITFMDKETLQYYKDVTEMRQQQNN